MDKLFYATAYARASKDDSDSSTIKNQLEIIRNFAEKSPDIRIVSNKEDNGYSGVDFLRPSFNEMMKDIEAGKINCVIVKDFSRLGRNYIEVGELMDEIFPRLNVRLISINDHYDSLNPRTDADEIIIPFKHLVDEHYLRENSKKIRVSLNAKRKNGEFVAAFAAYGYKRDANDKSLLVIDEHAAEVVRNIFQMKIEGMSQQKIAEYLNEIGEPSPAEYKKTYTKYKVIFQKNARSLWSAVAIGRILQNPVYVGTLIQGKQTTPNYKVRNRINKPQEEWDITTDAHESAVNQHEFAIVNALLNQDTRTSPNKRTLYPLSGLVYCADCGNNMIRTKSDKIFYYICASSRGKNKCCTSHCIQHKKLEQAVMEAVTHQINLALDVEKSIEYIQSLPCQQRNVAKLNALIAERENEIKSCEGYKRSLYEDYKEKIISKDDYIEFGKDYTARIDELQQAVARLHEEIELLINNENSALGWLTYFTQYRSIPELSRKLVVNIIERIEVMEGKCIIISFRYQDKFETACKILNETKEMRCS
ncbi:MAG: recombinase family protein [Defluviitaleaceae bacterium]|nr:recombinase family protein [Defluviitaleaceae bacterium]